VDPWGTHSGGRAGVPLGDYLYKVLWSGWVCREAYKVRIKRLDQLDSWVSIYLVGGIAELGKGGTWFEYNFDSSRGCERDYNNLFNGDPKVREEREVFHACLADIC